MLTNLGKEINCEAWSKILIFFCNKFNKFRIQDYECYILFTCHYDNFEVKTLRLYHYVYTSVIGGLT